MTPSIVNQIAAEIATLARHGCRPLRVILTKDALDTLRAENQAAADATHIPGAHPVDPPAILGLPYSIREGLDGAFKVVAVSCAARERAIAHG